MTDPNVPPQPQPTDAPPVEQPEPAAQTEGPHLAVAGDQLPPLVQVTESGEIAVDFQGALEHIPACILTQAQRDHPTEGAIEQLRQRVGQLLVGNVAEELVRDIIGLTNPEPEIVETAGGGDTVATPPATV